MFATATIFLPEVLEVRSYMYNIDVIMDYVKYNVCAVALPTPEVGRAQNIQ